MSTLYEALIQVLGYYSEKDQILSDSRAATQNSGGRALPGRRNGNCKGS